MGNLVPKIEGHATFYAHLLNGKIDEARIMGQENDRFVEKILLGRQYYEAPIITSRICGICPTIHSTTSIKAIEEACGIIPTEQTVQLRKLLLCGQMIQSHSLHLYLLVLPDFVGVESSFELQKSHPELFANAIILKKYADEILDAVGGRAVHPIADVPGGFKSYPSKEKLSGLLTGFPELIDVAKKTVELFNNFNYPQVKQDIIYSALSETGEYAYYDGNFINSIGQKFKPKNYSNYIYEELKHYTRAKFATIKGEEIMVGSMARMNLNKESMGKEVLALAHELNIKAHFDNPFENIIAQAIENYYFVIQSQKLIKYFIKNGIDKKEPVKPPQRFASGTAACEAPRGTLLHHYRLDDDGIILKCDIITPTVQNLPALEKDMKKLGPIIAQMEQKERNKTIEMLIRAYDPCITCATH